MKNIWKCGEEDADSDGSRSLSRLPDEIILLILNKVMDMKSLCCCCLVSKRFSSIVFNVDAIAFTAPPIGHIDDYDGGGNIIRAVFCGLINTPFLLQLFSSTRDFALFPLYSAIRFLIKFRGVKSLSVELPSSPHVGIDNGCLFKWKVKFRKRIECLYFLLPNSEVDVNGNGVEQEEEEEEEEDIDMGLDNNFYEQNYGTSIKCLVDANGWHKMLLYLLRNLRMLEKVSITDSGRSGRLSISGEKLREVKEWVHSASKTLMNRVEHPYIIDNCYIPALKLPISGYLMKGVYLLVLMMKGHQGEEYDNSDDGFEDKQEAGFTEALMEILEKRKSRMVRLWNGEIEVVYASGSE